MRTHVYFRKPLTNQLIRYDIDASEPYSVDQYKEYHKLAETQIGIPLKFVLIRVK